ncbi:hypothetical protein H8F22_19215 [Pseudomonas sp. P154a]|uniref:hypothetical protein n=1 Tax=Pseudomonas mucoides TaxID=2730424 RepID=UPI0018923C4A|nr:hypothetical protein [Pseudomonas mucoides]MBF6041013.1 hypothetical protein [Pseudomonas mucoides]
MVTRRLTPLEAFNSADPLPNPPPNTFPRPDGSYLAPLNFTGRSSYYEFEENAIVVGFVYPDEDREQRSSSAERDYNFSLPASPGPTVVQVAHGWMANDVAYADTYKFDVYILTPET